MTTQALNRPVDVLDQHIRGMRAASEGSGITLTAAACANLSKDLETVRAAVAELIETQRELLLEIDRAKAFETDLMQRIPCDTLARASAALAAIEVRP